MDEFETEQMHNKIDAMRAEVDELRALYASLRQTSGDLCVVCGWRFFVPDVGCLSCERARLEAEVDDLRLQREGHIIDNMHAYEEGVAEGERRATAYLRERANAEHPIERGIPSLSPAGRGLLLLHADCIERGEHIGAAKGEKP